MSFSTALKSLAQRATQPFSRYESAQVPADDVFKAVIPEYLYRPPFGRPRNIDAPEIRRIGRTPYAQLITNTVVDEVSSMEWEIQPIEGETVGDQKIQEYENFFKDPNENHESFKQLLSSFVRDGMELDSGVISKVFTKGSYENLQTHTVETLHHPAFPDTQKHEIKVYVSGRLKPPNKRELSQLYTRDGATFTMNPDRYGVLPETHAYYQYYWTVSHRAIAFNRDEIVYMMMRPRTYDVYGWSYLQASFELIDALMGGINMYNNFFRNNDIPPGFLQAMGANEKDIRALQDRIKSKLMIKDNFGNWNRLHHKMIVVNNEIKWTPVHIPPRDLEFLGQQEWFLKILLFNAGLTPNEVGWNDSSNKATAFVESRTFKRKVLVPWLDLIEFVFNTQICSEFDDPVQFKWVRYNLEDELEEDKLDTNRIKLGMITINEWRERKGMDSVTWGDEPIKQGGMDLTNQSLDESIRRFIPAGKNIEEKAFTTQAGGPAPDTQPAIAIGRGKTVKQEAQLLTVLLHNLLNQQARQIKKELEASLDNQFLQQIKSSPDQKAVINEVMEKLDHMMDTVDENIAAPLLLSIRNIFQKGLESVETELRLIFQPNQKAIEFVHNYTFHNIKDMTEEIANDLRAEIQRGLLNGEGVHQIKQRVNKVFEVSLTRSETIARTELNRAFNMGSLEGYKQSGLQGEVEWSAVVDEKTSPICRYLNGKTVKLGENFRYTDGTEYQAPPAHPNCRSTITFTPSPPTMVQEGGPEEKAISHWMDCTDPPSIADQSRILCRSRQTIYNIRERILTKYQDNLKDPDEEKQDLIFKEKRNKVLEKILEEGDE